MNVNISIREKHNLITVIVISKNGNYHRKIQTENLEFYYKFNGVKYQVRREGLYRIIPAPWVRFWDWVIARNRYLIVFGENEPKHLERQTFHISPSLIRKIRKSRVLRKAITELFKNDLLGGRGLLYLILVFLAIAVYILRIQGVI